MTEICETISVLAIEETMKKLFVSCPDEKVSNCVLLWNNDAKNTEVYPVSIVDDCIMTVKTRLAQLSYSYRYNLVGLCDWTIYCPDCFLFDVKSCDDYFVMAFEHTVSRYGVKNVIGGVVRFDEKTPCIHILFVPVVDNDCLAASRLLTHQEKAAYRIALHELANQKIEQMYSRSVAKNVVECDRDVPQDDPFVASYADKEAFLDSREQSLAEWQKNLELREELLDKRLAVLREREAHLMRLQTRANAIVKKSVDMVDTIFSNSAKHSERSMSCDQNT